MRSRINTFFIEIIIVILFFFVSIMVILQLFAAAHNKSSLNTSSNIAMVKVQSIAEQIKKECTAELDGEFLNSFTIENNGNNEINAYQYFNENWELSDKESKYKLILKLEAKDTSNGTMVYSSIDVYDISNKNQDDKIVCELDTQNYLSK